MHQHALSVNGKRKNITKEDLHTVGKSMNIKKMDDIINQILEVVKDWKKYALDVGVISHLKNKIQKSLTTHLVKF